MNTPSVNVRKGSTVAVIDSRKVPEHAYNVGATASEVQDGRVAVVLAGRPGHEAEWHITAVPLDDIDRISMTEFERRSKTYPTTSD